MSESQKLYLVGVDSTVRVWWCYFDPSTETIHACYGVVDGVITTTKGKKVTTNSSGRSLEQQVDLEMRSMIKNKMDAGYKLGDSPLVDSGKAMTANKWEPGKGHFPMAVQPKLDGIRCMVSRDERGKLRFRSRGNKEFTNLASSDIEHEVKAIIDHITLRQSDDPEDIELDGELYIHGKSFQTISSIVGTKKKSHPLLGEVKYCIFTYRARTKSHDERYSDLEAAFSSLGPFKSCLLVDQQIVESEEEVLPTLRRYVSQGYEGCMLYHISTSRGCDKKLSLYQSGRRNNILKVKDFDDSEGVVIDVIGGVGKDEDLGIFVVRTGNGTVAKMKPCMTDGERRSCLANKQEIIGKIVTYKHFGTTDDGIPRFPNVISFRSMM